MNAIEACKEINRIAELPHKQSKTLIDAVKVGVKQMLFTSDFYENDIVNVFIVIYLFIWRKMARSGRVYTVTGKL